MIKRRKDWVRRFEIVTRAASAQSFDWVEHNCCTFTGACFEAVTGEDAAALIGAEYTTKREALREIARYGGGTLEDALQRVMSHYGLREVSPTHANRGDLVLACHEDQLLAGCVDLSGTRVLVLHLDGLGRLPLTCAKRAWHIP